MKKQGLSFAIALPLKFELAIETAAAPHPDGAIPARDYPRISKNKGKGDKESSTKVGDF